MFSVKHQKQTCTNTTEEACQKGQWKGLGYISRRKFPSSSFIQRGVTSYPIEEAKNFTGQTIKTQRAEIANSGDPSESEVINAFSIIWVTQVKLRLV